MKKFAFLAFLSVSGIYAQDTNQKSHGQTEADAPLETQKKQLIQEEAYFELSRQEIDKIEKKCETLFQQGKDLSELAKKAADDRKIDECLGILKYKEFTLQQAIKETCKIWMQSHNDPNEKILLRKWIKTLQNKYPEEIYPLYVELVDIIFESDENPNLQNIDKIVSICGNPKPHQQMQELKDLENGVLLMELGLYLFVLGAEIKAFTLNEIASDLFKKNNSQNLQESPLDVFRYITLQQESKLIEIIENKQTGFRTLISALDALLPVQEEKALEVLKEKNKKEQIPSDIKLEFAKLFWRSGEKPEYEKIIHPFIKNGNINACVWHDQVNKLQIGLPTSISADSIVRLVFPLGTASGFFISEDGIIATAAHNFAINKNNPFLVRIYDSNKIKLTPLKIYIDPDNDLALILIKEKPKSYLSTLDEELKAGSTVQSIGFPLDGTQCHFQTLQVVASLPQASDILLTGNILRGMSGGPVVFSNKVIGINSTSLGPTKARYLSKGLTLLKQINENESNALSGDLKKNVFFQPKTIWANYFAGSIPDNPNESEMPDIYETPRSFSRFCKKVNKEQIEKIFNNPSSTSFIVQSEISDKNGDTQDGVGKLKEKNILREYPDYLEARHVPHAAVMKLKKILEYNRHFSPALGELALSSFLEAVGQKDDFEKLKSTNTKGNYQFYIHQIQNPKAFAEALDYMKRYWDTDPNLRWEFLPESDGVNETLKMYFALKKIGPLLIAQADGPLNNDKLKEFVQQGNTLAMAVLAERFLSEKESLQGYMLALQSAESGEPKGQSILAFYLLSGTAAAKNEKKGFEWAMKSAEAGDPRGSTIAGICLVQGIGTLQNKTKGMELIQNGIRGGDSTALQIAKNPGMENHIQFITPRSSTHP